MSCCSAESRFRKAAHGTAEAASEINPSVAAKEFDTVVDEAVQSIDDRITKGKPIACRRMGSMRLRSKSTHRCRRDAEAKAVTCEIEAALQCVLLAYLLSVLAGADSGVDKQHNGTGQGSATPSTDGKTKQRRVQLLTMSSDSRIVAVQTDQNVSRQLDAEMPWRRTRRSHAMCCPLTLRGGMETSGISVDVAAPEIEAAEEDMTSRKVLFSSLSKEDTRLLNPDWLVDLFFNSTMALPRRQEAPEDAFVRIEDPVDEATEIITISYCWLSRQHPDPAPLRYHLNTLAHMLQILKAKSLATYGGIAINSPLVGVFGNRAFGNGVFSNLRSREARIHDLLERRAFFGTADGTAAGVFLDWTALHQVPRSHEEDVVFKRALTNINCWYASPHTHVWKLVSLPPGVDRKGYEDSGWTTFEEQVSRMITPETRLLHVDDCLRARIVQEDTVDPYDPDAFKWEGYIRLMEIAKDRERAWPMDPEAFNAIIGKKHVTSGADVENVLKPKYKRTFDAVFKSQSNDDMQFAGLNLTKDGCQNLLKLLTANSKKVRVLNLAYNRFMDCKLEEMVELMGLGESTSSSSTSKASPFISLTHLNLKFCNMQGSKILGDIGVLAEFKYLQHIDFRQCGEITGDIKVFASCAQLKYLDLEFKDDFISDHGRDRLKYQIMGDIGVFQSCKRLQHLDLTLRGNITGNIGALSSCVELQHLTLQYCLQVTGDIGALRACTQLRVLNCCVPELTRSMPWNRMVTGDIGELRACSQLQVLNCGGCEKVTGDLQALKRHCPELEDIKISTRVHKTTQSCCSMM